jgi:hypothetical protein
MNPALLYFIFGMGTGIFAGHWKPLAFLAPKPPTAELHQAQADRDALKTQLDATQARSESDAKAIADKTDQQAAGALQMVQGSILSHARVPLLHQVAEERLANSFVVRAGIRLVAMRGRGLSDADETEIESIVSGALSAKQVEVDAANARLADKDADFQKVTAEKAAITADKAKTDQVVEQQKTQLAAKDAKVNDLTNTVAAKADALDSEKRNSGSLLGSLGSAWHWIEGLGVVAVIIAGLLLYLRMGLGSVGKGLHGLQSVLSPEDYQKVVSHLDGETDKLHQWLIRGGREAAAKIASLTTQPKT